MQPIRPMSRRDYVRIATASLLSTSNLMGQGPTARQNSSKIHFAQLGKPVRLTESGGDTWIAAWADDGDLYVTSDDTSGFRHACGSNLAINRVTGAMPPELHGETVNCMEEYGGGSETRKEDGGMWKACGVTCGDRVLYMAVSRQLTSPTEPNRTWEGRYAPYPIQETWDSSIVKSVDHGKTWSPMPRSGRAMFPGRMFSTLSSCNMGKMGRAIGMR